MSFKTMDEALAFIFSTRHQIQNRGLDEVTRNPEHTRHLLDLASLSDLPIEYAVVTGSKGKGSVTILTASLLRALSYRVGTITSPHHKVWFERIRVDGKMIPEADFLRILSQLEPFVEAIYQQLPPHQYLSPQGLFLAIALSWFQEQGVNRAVLEVGRGGRFDDIAVVPNQYALFSPIFREHTQYMGELDRIAWHKAGIMKPDSWAFSLPQSPPVAEILEEEAQQIGAHLQFVETAPVHDSIRVTDHGLHFTHPLLGETELSLWGDFQVDNALLALEVVNHWHPQLDQASQSALKEALAQLKWYGRLQRLQENPAVWVDGAINVLSAQSFLDSILDLTTKPLIIILGVPQDRDVPAVYELYARYADVLIITETDIHPNIHFPPAAEALELARQFHQQVDYFPNLPQALESAFTQAGTSGTILLAVAQPLVGEAMLIWDIDVASL